MESRHGSQRLQSLLDFVVFQLRMQRANKFGKMSSALGTTIENGGETGTVTKLQHMPDQLPDNPGTISANTSLETLEQVMYRNWIWRNNFIVDSSMLPGHVFGYIKIHPANCNDYITYISKLFLTWDGALKIRTRIMATFQFGGSLRIGFLPPKFTQQQIQQMPIQTLTAYPNIDLDPKNTNWVEFQASDERNILFHWMDDLNSDDPQSFGGWFVFYVASPIVVSGGVTSTISLLVESAGSFNFSQLAPITAIKPTASGWIDSDYVIGQTGADDNNTITGIQILPATIKSLSGGFFGMKGLAKEPITSLPSVKVSENLKKYITEVDDGNRIVQNLNPGKATRGAGDKECYIGSEVIGLEILPNAEPTAMGSLLIPVGYTQQESFPPTMKSCEWRSDGYIQYRGETTSGGAREEVKGLVSPRSDATQRASPIDTTKIGIPEEVFAQTLEGESLVLFVNTTLRTINTQTRQHKQFLARVPNFQNTTSQLYQLRRDGQASPLLTLRLTPWGYWTTRATDVVALLSDEKLYLTYLQDLPMSTPIPGNSYSSKFLRYAGRCTQKQYKSKLEWDVNCYSLF